ncbi:hypothetical protein EYC84_003443 [Monilinia fructicola]|uniref:FCP1 homology domain-containing protein n=1 Tax=Monilinia fructicola TaxID=38448 RepID=A0A5M9JTN1_MONFR|nr:hypothetical protein EYC84_003443 [Monilinia fructicola]
MAPMSKDAKVQPSRASGGIPNPTSEYIAGTSPGQNTHPLHSRPSPARSNRSKMAPFSSDLTKRIPPTKSSPSGDAKPSVSPPSTLIRACNATSDSLNFGPTPSSQLLTPMRKTVADGPDNTVLIDDSSEKARSEPYNLIEIPEFFGDHKEVGDILPQVHDFLNFLSMHENVSAAIRHSPFVPQPKANPREATGLNLPIHPPRVSTPVTAPAQVLQPAHSSDNMPSKYQPRAWKIRRSGDLVQQWLAAAEHLHEIKILVVYSLLYDTPFQTHSWCLCVHNDINCISSMVVNLDCIMAQTLSYRYQ